MVKLRWWRNWQTRYFEGVVFTRRMGSSPIHRTILTCPRAEGDWVTGRMRKCPKSQARRGADDLLTLTATDLSKSESDWVYGAKIS